MSKKNDTAETKKPVPPKRGSAEWYKANPYFDKKTDYRKRQWMDAQMDEQTKCFVDLVADFAVIAKSAEAVQAATADYAKMSVKNQAALGKVRDGMSALHAKLRDVVEGHIMDVGIADAKAKCAAPCEKPCKKCKK